MLSMRSLLSATVLPSNSYYTVVASIFLISAASCKAICRVASVRTSDIFIDLRNTELYVKANHIEFLIDMRLGDNYANELCENTGAY